MTRIAKVVLLAAVTFVVVWMGARLYRQTVEEEPAPAAPAAVAPAPPAQEPLVVAQGRLSDWEKSVTALFKAAAPSVAYITTEARRFDPLSGVELAQGAGSGFVWDAEGHIVTNFHVIEDADTVYVQLDVGDPIPAKVIGGSPDYDIAVVRLSEVPKGLRPLPVGDSKALQVGQSTFAIGNPFGLSRTLTTGIVSALERRLPTSRGREVRGVIQTDAAINPGNSGGPLLDSSGRLIGVNSAIYSESGTSAGIGFAIPVDLVKRVVPQIIRTGRAPRPGIGIAAADERIASQLGVQGVMVLGVARGSPAQKAGIQPWDLRRRRVGDVIVALDGKPVATLSDFAAMLDDIGVGKEITLTVRRDDKDREVKTRTIDLQD
ncbi:MAG TPA: trypsin-like peptidase domain-containing protein [Burkholderiales bacterium]|nr:trypsin-like peptidase domain-containing protein [Burkholderiales bacterium]